jgi:heme oxygenase
MSERNRHGAQEACAHVDHSPRVPNPALDELQRSRFLHSRQSSMNWALTRLERRLGDRADTVAAIVGASIAQPTRESYRRFLCDLYGFVTAFEARFAFALGLDIAFIENRIKSGRMATDLLALGLTAYERVRLSRRCVVPMFVGSAEALGWLFVVERLTLDFPSIRNRLRAAIPYDLEIAGSFIGADTAEIESSWSELGRVLDRHVHAKPELERTMHAAEAALLCLEEWVLLPPGTVEVDADQLRAQ